MLPWTQAFIERCAFDKVITNSRLYQLEHLPPMISDVCLQSAPDELGQHVKASLLNGHTVRSEVIPMPRGTSGDRPIIHTDLATRVAYAALVSLTKDVTEADSRSLPARRDFQEFGSEPSQDAAEHEQSTHVLIADIAACYEYIVPELLTDELLLRTDDYPLVERIKDLLTELSTLGRGIPQMLPPSDRLADIYLSKIDRALSRANLEWRRTADDYKIISDWPGTNSALELLEREVRAAGLILSADKTRVVRRGTSAIARMSGGGADGEPDSDETTDIDTADALLEWHSDWKQERGQKRVEPPPASDINDVNDIRSLGPEVISDIVFAHRPHLEYVIKMLHQSADSDPDSLVTAPAFLKMLESRNLNAWEILWIMHGADKLSTSSFKDQIGTRCRDLAKLALQDGHESVRVQAGWFLAKNYSLTVNQVRQLHVRSSQMTSPGVSAVASLIAGRSTSQKKELEQVAVAIASESVLNKRAAVWAKPVE